MLRGGAIRTNAAEAAALAQLQGDYGPQISYTRTHEGVLQVEAISRDTGRTFVIGEDGAVEEVDQ